MRRKLCIFAAKARHRQVCGGRSCIPQEIWQAFIYQCPARKIKARYRLLHLYFKIQLLITVPQHNPNPRSVPYFQATGPPYCSPPARYPASLGREYPGPSAAYRRRDTDGRRRQLTMLPRPCPQHPPFTLGNGILRFLSILLHRVSGLSLLPVTDLPGSRSYL